MDSLTISNDSETLFVQMPDDEDAETAEDIFKVVQRIFEIPLPNPEEQQPIIIIDQDREMGVFDFTLAPNEEAFIYQAVSNADAGGTFQYELYKYNRKTQEDQQLTNLQEYAGQPVINPKTDQVYFTVDKQFADQTSDYHLYKMNKDGTEVEEVILPENVQD